MPNDIFKRAISEALTQEYINSVPKSEEHIFSEKFERKMSKLIKRRKKPYYMLINTVGKRVACFIIGIIIASSLTIMNVDALRDAFVKFVVNIFEKFSIVQSADQSNSPQTIEDIYVITYDLSDFSIDYEEYDSYCRNITYIRNIDVIDFFQFTKNTYDMLLNTEDADIETIDINGYKAIYYIDNHNYHHLIWDNGDYIISISSNIGKTILIDVANSVQIDK